MPTVSLTLPVAGTVITAGLHSANYTALQTLLNGGLDTSNWASGKIFAPSKLMQESAVDGDGLAWENASSTWKRTTDKTQRIASLSGVPSAALALPVVYDRATTTVDVANTVTETSIYTKLVTGGDMGTNRMLRATIIGDYLHNNVAGDTVTFRIKFGGTTFYAAPTSMGGVLNARRQAWHINVRVANLAATNSQMIGVDFLFSADSGAGAPSTGVGDVAGWQWAGAISTLGTIDTTANQTLDVTAQWSAASANNSWRARYGVLELI